MTLARRLIALKKRKKERAGEAGWIRKKDNEARVKNFQEEREREINDEDYTLRL